MSIYVRDAAGSRKKIGGVGLPGPAATINGVNTLTVTGGRNIDLEEWDGFDSPCAGTRAESAAERRLPPTGEPERERGICRELVMGHRWVDSCGPVQAGGEGRVSPFHFFQVKPLVFGADSRGWRC